MKTNESLLVVVPLLKRYEVQIDIFDTLDSIAEKAKEVSQVVIYSDSSDYLQEVLNRCQESISFSGFPPNVTTCVLGNETDLSGIIEVALTDWDHPWILLLEPGFYLNNLPKALPDPIDFGIISCNSNTNTEINSKIIPLTIQDFIMSAAFLRGTEAYKNFDSDFCSDYLFLDILKTRADIITEYSCTSLVSTRLGECANNKFSFDKRKEFYQSAWEILKNDSQITEKILDTIKDWLWNTLNNQYLSYLIKTYPELKDQIELDLIFLFRKKINEVFNK